MTFGKRGAATLGDYGNYSSSDGGEQSTSRPGGEYEMRAGAKDLLMGAFVAFVGAVMVTASSVDLRYGAEALAPMLVGGLLVVGGGYMALMALLQRPKLIVDQDGIHQNAMLGRTTVSWDEMHRFEIWTVNFNKIVYALSTENTPFLMKKRVTIPNDAFKSKDLELVKLVRKYRPDLLPQMPDIMKAVGAGKLARKHFG